MKPAESKNLLVELARKKTAEQAAGKSRSVLGKDLAGRPSKRVSNISYSWRGGRNGQGKP